MFIKKQIKKIRHIIEALFAFSLCGLLSVFSIDTASNIAGFIFRKLGRLFHLHKVAQSNLRLIFPQISEAKREEILEDMWSNIGRNVAELIHFSTMKEEDFLKRVEINVVGKLPKGPLLFISAHQGNWELLPRVGRVIKRPCKVVVRHLSNPYIDWLIAHFRRRMGAEGLIAKNQLGVRDIINTLSTKGAVGMLADHRLNDGENSMFMGHAALSTNLPEKLVKKKLCTALFVKCERLKGSNFRVTIYSKKFPPNAFTRGMNDELSAWVASKPEQWFWIHNRWRLSFK